ncbi:MAG: hypothetical protein QXF01_02835 [Candidatus Micrarchaeaceae archaeon]
MAEAFISEKRDQIRNQIEELAIRRRGLLFYSDIGLLVRLKRRESALERASRLVRRFF